MNPDIRLNGDPFKALLACLQDSAVGVAVAHIEYERRDRRQCPPFPDASQDILQSIRQM